MDQSSVFRSARPDPARAARHHYPVWLEVPTRFGDLDPLGHLNNVAIAQFYEEARVSFGRMLIERCGGGLHRMVLAALSVHYLMEARYPEPVEVGTGVARVGRSSYTVAHALYQDDKCVGLADSTMVHAPVTGVAPLPDPVLTVLDDLRLT